MGTLWQDANRNPITLWQDDNTNPITLWQDAPSAEAVLGRLGRFMLAPSSRLWITAEEVHAH